MEIRELMNQFAQPGRVVAISIRPDRKVSVKLVESVFAIQNKGLEGDRSKGGNRQVTFIQKEHIAAIASFLGKSDLDYTITRRNFLVESINLFSLKGKQFQIGEAVFEYSGECHPCSRMEEGLGIGGYNAMRGHGGITARVVLGGKIKEGDAVIPLLS